MAGETADNLVKMFIWTTGRCMSNVLLKCMTYIPDSVIWHEPYTQIRGHSDLIKDPVSYVYYKEQVKINGGITELAKLENGYDASDKDYDWLKQQLEADYPGKRLLVVKNAADDVLNPSLQQIKIIPQGFRHTFLIRNPRKVIASYAKVQLDLQAKFKVLPNIGLHEHIYVRFKHQYEMWKYVQADGLESRPLIIDADDLIGNPKEVLEAYFQELGIPFSEDLLTWPAGDDYLKNWMVSKQNLLVYKRAGRRGVAEASTGFNTKPASSATDDDRLKDEPSDKLAKLNELIDKIHPYYEEMYTERIVVKK